MYKTLKNPQVMFMLFFCTQKLVNLGKILFPKIYEFQMICITFKRKQKNFPQYKKNLISNL